MFSLTQEHFDDWMEAYGRAWIDGDADIIRELYSQDAEYYETPYKDHFLDLDAIVAYWHEGAGTSQKDVKFSYRILAVAQDTGLAKWEASFVRIPSGNSVELDGIMQVEFNQEGKCRVFREWWHRRESSDDGVVVT